jgi:hypothetical protein
VLLAELEVWHSRPITPTRRVSLGNLVLPVDPLPGFGGLLIGAVVAGHLPGVDPDLLPDLQRLVHQVARGDRVAQPRLRHRYQVDRHGLARSTHRLVGDGEQVNVELENNGTDLQQVLGAIYATERLAPVARRSVAEVIDRATRWPGPVGPSFIAYLAGIGGTRGTSLMSFADPIAWALDILGFAPGTVKPDRKDVVARYRNRLRQVHPDHGGIEASASKAISDLGEARRILSSVE